MKPPSPPPLPGPLPRRRDAAITLTVNTPAFVPDSVLRGLMEELELLSSKLNELEEIARLQKELFKMAGVAQMLAGPTAQKERWRHAQRSRTLDYTATLIKETRDDCQSLVNSIKKRSAERAHERARIKRHFC